MTPTIPLKTPQIDSKSTSLPEPSPKTTNFLHHQSQNQKKRETKKIMEKESFNLDREDRTVFWTLKVLNCQRTRTLARQGYYTKEDKICLNKKEEKLWMRRLG